MATPPTAFVAGATGYLGRALVYELAQRGARTVAHVRPDSSRSGQWKERFDAAGAEILALAWEHEPLLAALRQLRPTHVFCTIGTTRKSARVEGLQGSIYEEVDFGLTRLLVAACTELEHPPRFVYVSSLGTRENSRGAYLRARWRAEEAVRTSGLPYTIARPPIITGPGRDEPRPLERVGAAVMNALSRVGGLLGAQRFAARYRATDAEELAYGLVHAAFNYTTIDRVLEAEELRYRTANDREYYLPRSRRDADRH